MKVLLIAEYANGNYFRGLIALSKQKKIDLTISTYYLVPTVINFLKKKIEPEYQPVTTKTNNVISDTFTQKLSKMVKSDDFNHDFFRNPASIISLFSADVVIIACSPYHSLIYFYPLLSFLNKKVIFSTSWPYWTDNRQPYRGDAFRKKLWRNFLQNRRTHTVTDAAGNEIKKFGASTNTIPHSVDASIFTPNPINHQKIRILFVGRVEEDKGIFVLIEALKILKRKNIELWIAGIGSAAEKVEKLKLPFVVKQLGFVNDKKTLNEIYNSCDIFVNASYATPKWEELFGISIIEAMSCELPVISSDCIGPVEIIEHNKNGLIFQQKNASQLADHLARLIKDEKLRKSFGQKSRQRVLQKYDIKVVAKKWSSLLQEAMCIL